MVKNESSLYIELNTDRRKMEYSLFNIYYFIIKKLIKNAEIYLNKEIKKIVLTVPIFLMIFKEK